MSIISLGSFGIIVLKVCACSYLRLHKTLQKDQDRIR